MDNRTACPSIAARLAPWLGAVLLLVVLSTGSASAGQTDPDLSSLEIEELGQVEIDTVQGASKYRQDLGEAPSSVTIVTRDDIRKYGYRTLAELLQSVRGFSVTYDRNYHYAGIRGFNRPGDYGTRFLLLVDGMRINDAVYDQTPLGINFPLDMDLIDHVEIIRGASQSIYGSNAVFGVINVVTRTARDLGGFEVAASGGSFSTYGGRLSYGNRLSNGTRLLLSGSFTGSAGQDLHFREYDQPGVGDGWARGADGSRAGSGFFRLSHGDLALEGLLSDSRKTVPTAPWETVFNTSSTRTTDRNQLLSLTYEHSYPSGLDVMARITGSWYRYEGDYLYDRETPPPSYDLGRDKASGYWLGYDLTLVKELGSHKLMLGSELRRNYRQDQSYRDENGLWSDRRDSLGWGVFAQDEYRLLDSLILNAGLRYDHFTTFGSTTNPRIALIWSPLDDTVVKLLYGRAFRAPSAYELYYFQPDPPQPHHLRHETIDSYEAVLEQKLGERFSATVDAFFISMRDIISQDSADPQNSNLPFTNSGEFETKGIELALKGNWSENLRGVASYSLQYAHDENTDRLLANAPRQLGKLNLTAPLPGNRIFIGLVEQYTGERKTISGSTLPGYWLTNLTLFAPALLPNLQLSASVYNLFNTTYDDPGAGEHLIGGLSAIRQDGRSFRVTATLTF